MRQSLKGHGFWLKLLPLLPGLCAAIGVIALLKLGTWQPLEDMAYTVLFQLRGSIACDKRVVIVAVDETSLSQLGRFPWSRKRYTQLLNIITPTNPSAVVFNILLSEPSPDDPELAAAMRKQGRVVLAEAWDRQGRLLSPSPTLKQAAVTSGHIYQLQDSDGLARQVEFQVQGVSALSLAAAQLYSLVQEPVPLPRVEHSLWINWLGATANIPAYSYVDVLNGKVSAQTFQNKIVLVGVTATGLDPLQTPYDRNPPTTSVYLHATLINNLLQRNLLQVPAGGWVLLGLLLGGSGLSYAVQRWRQRRWLGLLGLCLGWGLLSLLLFRLGYWLPVAAPLGLFVATAAAVSLHDRWQENALLRQEVTRLWQTYRPDLVTRAVDLTRLSAVFHPRSLCATTLQTSQIAQLSVLAEQFGRSHAAQTAIARSLSIGLVAADLDGWVWFCNPVAMTQLQVQLGDALPTCLVPLWLDKQQWQTCIDALQRQEPVAPQEIQQNDRWYELKLEPLVYRPGAATAEQPQGLLLLLEDITAQKQVEAHLRQQMQGLEESHQLKDDFLSAVSHELRSPLSNIKMMVQMLQLTAVEEQRHYYLQLLEQECDRETALIDDLLDLQRLENGYKAPTLEEINLQTWLPRLLEPFHERTQARQQTLRLHLAESSPLLSDKLELERILVELINNACKYTPPGETIAVAVQTTPCHVNFVISNSGSEIPPAELTKIFEKFYRVPNSDRWQQGGTGLGLTLVKKLVERLHGTIQVTSQPDQTTFTVQIPRQIPQQSQQERSTSGVKVPTSPAQGE